MRDSLSKGDELRTSLIDQFNKMKDQRELDPFVFVLSEFWNFKKYQYIHDSPIKEPEGLVMATGQ